MGNLCIEVRQRRADALPANDRPDQRDSVLRVIGTGAQELDGPLPLIQGGTGVVVRVPVFLPEADGTRRYRALVQRFSVRLNRGRTSASGVGCDMSTRGMIGASKERVICDSKE